MINTPLVWTCPYDQRYRSQIVKLASIPMSLRIFQTFAFLDNVSTQLAAQPHDMVASQVVPSWRFQDTHLEVLVLTAGMTKFGGSRSKLAHTF